MRRNKKLGYNDTFGDFKRWLADQSKGSYVVAIAIILGVGYVIFGFGYDADYNEQVEYEKKLAMVICESSREWVMNNPKRLKHGQADLKDLKVDGKTITLKHVKYPEVLFLDSGIRKIGDRGNTANDLYCHFKDPRRSSLNYYYNYKTLKWVDKVRFRR